MSASADALAVDAAKADALLACMRAAGSVDDDARVSYLEQLEDAELLGEVGVQRRALRAGTDDDGALAAVRRGDPRGVGVP